MQEESMMDRAASADLRRGVGIAIVIDGKTIQLANDQNNGMQMSAQSQATLQSLQHLQNTPPISSNYAQGGRQTGSQQSLNLGGDKRENGNARSPLADSFVL